MSRSWTVGEERALTFYAAQGTAFLAELLQRSVPAVKIHAAQIGVRIGRAASLSDTQRIPSELLARAERLLKAQLCPRCGMRPVEVPRTGLCLACHKKALADAHRAKLAEEIAQRELNVAKQQLCRFRGEETGGDAASV